MNIQKTLNIILALSLLILLIKINTDKKEALPQANTSDTTDYSELPKKNIGQHSGLYPTPTTIVGTKVDGKINWIAIAHIGNIGHDCLILSMHKSHHSNQGIKANKTLSINMVSESMMIPADYVGMVSGKDVDKSEVFETFEGTLSNAPMIKASPICMEAELIDNYETEDYDNFVVKIQNTYVSETILNEKEQIDYNKFKPLLFEMPEKSYFKVGPKVGNAWKEGKEYIP